MGCNNNPEIQGSFEGQVIRVELLSQFEGKAVPIDLDPRFVIVIYVTQSSLNEIPVEQQAAFCIHSPTRLFAKQPEQIVGQSFRFILKDGDLKVEDN